MAGPLIVLAELGKPDFAWLNALRRTHYPPERNRVPAHLTLFHALPPSVEEEVRRRLAKAASGPAPGATITGIMDLGSGAAFRIDSPGLQAIRAELANAFTGLLTAQDDARWTPHVTVQNKVEPRVSRKLLAELRAGFEPRPLAIAGLALVRYVEGDWEPLKSWRFR